MKETSNLNRFDFMLGAINNLTEEDAENNLWFC